MIIEVVLYIMKDPLPVPDQLEKQLSKCKTVRDADTFYKSRDKTKEVSLWFLCFVDGVWSWILIAQRGAEMFIAFMEV